MRYRSKQVQAAVALILLITSVILCSPLGASANSTGATYMLAATPTPATCPTPGNNACITSINSTPTVGVTLNGTDQSLSFTMLYTLNNSVSSNWHVTIALTQFTTTSTPHRTLPTTTTITAVTVVPSCSGNTCPVNAISYPLSVTAGNTPVTFFNNTGGGSHGVGSFTIQTTMSISVPGNAYAGIYTSTFTIAFVSGSA
ncbi:MAG TPA: hypothetical protein VFQ30_10860 [Ktedonobacteraceae bacterium]|nr:hypothetical protein [Ktedonobacteraceae bacterium]